MATFIAALVAANMLTDVELGVYAVFYTAFNFGQVIANNLVYIPSEVVVVSWPKEDRLRALGKTTRLAIGPSIAGAAAIGVAFLISINVADLSLVGPLTITASVTTLLWPTQDHVRRMLHIAGLSWQAATVSVVQFVTVVASIGGLIGTGVPDIWIPYGALAIANATSLTYGVLLARRHSTVRPLHAPLRLRNLIRSGAWLLVGVGGPTLSAMGAATIITFVAGPEILGYAEAARIVAQPVLVLGIGFGFVLGPRAMKAAIAHDQQASRSIHLRFTGIVSLAALAYAAIAGWGWVGNPMATLLPNAYEVAWLVPATIAAHVVIGGLGLKVQELMAAGQARPIGVVGLLTAPIQLLAAATAGVTGALARPLAMITGSGARYIINGRLLTKMYQQPPSGRSRSSSGDDFPPKDS